MASKTKIQWTDASWNPVAGCTKISPGCLNCYAERMAHRQAHTEQSRYKGMSTEQKKLFNFKYSSVVSWRLEGKHGNWNGDTYCDESALEIPLHWRKPRRIFVCSMSDLFLAPFEFIDKVMFMIYRSYRFGHTYQILTKRPERMLEYFSGDVDMRILNLFRKLDSKKYTAETRLTDSIGTLSRVWLGVTVCNQKEADEKIPILLQIPAAVRFVSIEPMLGAIDLRPYIYGGLFANPNEIGKFHEPLDWVIVGGESGPGARPMHPDWARGIRDQCGAASVPFFFKQWGEWGIAETRICPQWKGLSLAHESVLLKGNTPFKCFPENRNATIPLVGWVRVGKKKAGRLLDGREWSEYPR